MWRDYNHGTDQSDWWPRGAKLCDLACALDSVFEQWTELHWLGQHKSTGIAGLLPFRAAARHVRLQISNPGQILANSHEWRFLSFSFSSVWFHLEFDFFRVLVRVEFGYMMKHKIHPRSRGIGGCISTWAETNTSSTRLPGSSNYLNYPIASIRIR